MAICGYDNENDIPYEIENLSCHIKYEFNACKIFYLKESRDEVIKGLEEEELFISPMTCKILNISKQYNNQTV